jgi:hypothetical protein
VSRLPEQSIEIGDSGLVDERELVRPARKNHKLSLAHFTVLWTLPTFSKCSAVPDVSNVLQPVIDAIFPPDASTSADRESSHFVTILSRTEAWLSYSRVEKARVYELLKGLVREIVHCSLVPLRAGNTHMPSIMPSVRLPSVHSHPTPGKASKTSS